MRCAASPHICGYLLLAQLFSVKNKNGCEVSSEFKPSLYLPKCFNVVEVLAVV
jgi:hypothetical protein